MFELAIITVLCLIAAVALIRRFSREIAGKGCEGCKHGATCASRKKGSESCQNPS